MELGLILLFASLLIFAVLVKGVSELLEHFESKQTEKTHLREQL